jgi:hypothetical protein
VIFLTFTSVFFWVNLFFHFWLLSDLADEKKGDDDRWFVVVYLCVYFSDELCPFVSVKKGS